MARLPNVERAVVDDAKIVDYLLCEQHEDGRGKALFFIGYGFRPQEPEKLRQALLELARNCDVVTSQPSPHGTKYVVTGPIQAPDGRAPVVRTVWLIDKGRQVARLITAFPGRKSGA